MPVLQARRAAVWDSLAICEYVCELAGRGWPADRAARAIARSVCAEMHSGFSILRSQWPMNARAAGRRTAPNPERAADIARIEELWSDCRRRFGASGPWLFGEYSVADAMYAPVVLRFRTYGARCATPRPRTSRPCSPTRTCGTGWRRAAAESWIIESSEIGEHGPTGELMNCALRACWPCEPGACTAQLRADGSRAFTPTDLNLLARVSDPQVSPDGRYVVYVLRETDLEANRGRTDLWLLDLDEANAEAAAAHAALGQRHAARAGRPTATSIYFLSTRSGSSQVWRLPLAGGEAMQVTDYPLDVGTFRFSPTATRSPSRWKCSRTAPT